MVKMLGAEPVLTALEQPSLPEAQQALLKAVAESRCESAPATATVNPLLNMLAITGEKVTRLIRLLWLLSGFIGQTLSTRFYILPRPKRRSEEHTSELQSRPHLVCRLLLEKRDV